MHKILQNKLSKLTIKIFFSYIFLTLNAYPVLDEEETTSTGKQITLRVYLLHTHINIVDALKENDSAKKAIKYEKHDCKINPGCSWYSKPKTLTIPKFWNLVHRGTGIDLKGIDDDNTSEHWLYYVKSGEKKFGVVFGKGEFFKTEELELTEENKKFKARIIDKQYGDPEFGSKIVKNVVETPERISKEKGTIGGKPYNGCWPFIRGLDFCSISLSCGLEQIPSVCERLWHYSQGTS